MNDYTFEIPKFPAQETVIDVSRLEIRRIHVYHQPDTQSDMIDLRVVLYIRNIGDGEPGEVVSRELVDRRMMDKGRVDTTVRCAIVRALKHEIDECLYINGARVGNPHPEVITLHYTGAAT